MKRSSSWARVWACVALVAVASSFLVPGVAVAAPTAPQAAPPKQIVLIDGANKILVMNYAAGLYNILWTTGTIDGWQTGWTNFATGDFNGDGDQEIVAIRYDQNSSRGQIKVFDPVIKGGAQPVDFSFFLEPGQVFNLLATGDFEGRGRDQIVASYTYTDGSNNFHENLVEFYPTDTTGRAWGVRAVDWFGSSLQAMTAGDLNRDGLADLSLVRNADRRLLVKSGQSGVWSTLFEDAGYCCNWNGLAVGKVLNDADHPGNDLVVVRSAPNDGFNAMVFFWWSLNDDNSTMTDLTPDPPAYFNNPSFNRLALANLDGNTSGLRQIVGLRTLGDNSAYANTVFVRVFNPAATNIAGFEDSGDYGLNAWKQVAAGDLTGDGRDQVVLLRSNALRVYERPWADASRKPDLVGGFLPAALAVANIGFGATSVLTVAPTPLAYNLQYGTQSEQSVSVTNSGGGGPLSWTASKLTATSWLKLNGGETASGSTPGTLRVSVDATLAGVGSKSATVRVQSSDGTQAKDIPVNVTVADPGLWVVPNSVVLWHDKSIGTTTTGSISLSYPAGGAANWTISGKPTWLTVTPSSGTATVPPMAITFSADPAQVGNVNGVYNATITFSAGSGPAPRSVPVTFIVADRVTRGWMPIIGR